MSKYQHVIDVLLNKDKITTVGGPRSTWYEKIYPKPTIWVTKHTLKNKKS